MAKFIYREFKTRDGEREYYHKAVHPLDNDDNPEDFLNELIANFWGHEATVDDMGNLWFFGEIITSVYNWYYIDEDDYDVLKKFL